VRAYGGAVLAILWKDFLLEVRAKEVVTPVLVFALLVVITFNFVFDRERSSAGVVASGAMWASFTFGGILGLGRAFALERERGGLDGLALCPVGRDAIYLGKLLSSLLFMLAVEAVMLPVLSILFDLPLVLPALWLVVVLATLGFASVGTVFSALAANTRAREVLLPVLFFPVVVPVIIAAVESTSVLFQGGGWAEIGQWVGLLAAFDAVFIVVSAALFQFVVAE